VRRILQTVTFHPTSAGVSCPHCGSVVGADRIIQSNSNETKGSCQKCRQWFAIDLPVVRKKLVYLDQSLLSEFCRSADSHNEGQIEQRILRKLQKLKDRQKVFIVVSDIHSAETAAFPQEYADQRDKLWQFQNTLADGQISGNWSDVFIAQQLRALAAPDFSRRHARIFWDGSTWMLEGLKSSNGTFIGEFQAARRLTGSSVIKPGEIFRVGLTRLRLGDSKDERLANAVAAAAATRR
jgi:NAD-dependent SIR2 family protein deacetylase